MVREIARRLAIGATVLAPLAARAQPVDGLDIGAAAGVGFQQNRRLEIVLK